MNRSLQTDQPVVYYVLNRIDSIHLFFVSSSLCTNQKRHTDFVCSSHTPDAHSQVDTTPLVRLLAFTPLATFRQGKTRPYFLRDFISVFQSHLPVYRISMSGFPAFSYQLFWRCDKQRMHVIA
ncbi:hypothetical protein CRM22_007118 [Opisthorchis felineus]|uniref:Uncharacterized protein n=1 Tax=Opisthorchis felineus TaxID=147828 RepID=A0A4S2LQ65_OPIFE|nr:hypothetical protein CRM22_007118 [Opisthorchis felineus]